MKFVGKHILSVSEFDRAAIERVFAVADQMEPYAQRKKATRVLEGAILGSMFFEPSTQRESVLAAHLTYSAEKFAKPPSSKPHLLPRGNPLTTLQGCCLAIVTCL